jgi:hypothetical protein
MGSIPRFGTSGNPTDGGPEGSYTRDRHRPSTAGNAASHLINPAIRYGPLRTTLL